MSDQNKKKSFSVVRETLKYFLPVAWKVHKGYFFVGLLKTLAEAVQPFVAIFVSPLIIEELLGDRDIGRLTVLAAVIAVLPPLISFLGSFLGEQMEKYDYKFQAYFSEEMSKRIMELDFQLTEDKKALDQVEAARTGISWYSGGVHGICDKAFSIIREAVKIAGTVALIAVNAPLLFLITLIAVIIRAVLGKKENKIEIEAFEKLSKINRCFGYFCQSTSDFRYGKDIRLYSAKDLMTEKWEGYTDQSIGFWRVNSDKEMPICGINTFFDIVRDTVSYLYLGILVLTGGISIPLFTQMLSAGSTFNSSMQDLTYHVQNITKRCNYAYEYVKLMKYPAAIEKGKKSVENIPHTIEFKNVSFTYPNTDVKVLKDISVTLRQGEHLSVVGLNGAGKTTFVKLLCRLYDPTSGEILLDGVNIKEYDYNQYMSLFAPVFQDFKLFAFSIRENIILDGPGNDKELEKLAEQVGLRDKLASLEKGDSTVLFKSFDENGIEPSGGEQQKLAIARALYKNSPTVILDEPTAALDPVAEYDIYRQFNALVGGKTAVYISHRLSSCRFCDKIAVFGDGRVKEYGTHEELAGIDGGIYAGMFAAQAQYYD
ncbi:MAG: ABC transporter ATP-binding protein/permease [Firmicutes bacterium]|nr:ABC transporter ATP-binding protein/permease [Bacillota bacterium]